MLSFKSLAIISFIPVVFATCLGPNMKFREKGSREILFSYSDIHLYCCCSHNRTWISDRSIHQGFKFLNIFMLMRT